MIEGRQDDKFVYFGSVVHALPDYAEYIEEIVHEPITITSV